ncbi:helix-turn-helix domain-containing protein [Pigmentiphaga sp.]|uniref:helix-turn-helix domain-containing protein n=1 Tax=Pigmentiphaga sp. TaxID=1977564 RepID=UPI0025FDDB0E|nr:helix-turn-helix domain-containing protein [Pigmentiphaga sp.]MBX6319755.1 helix-turn-helix domain-containing protein [Pigmentiphaga sp.]
MIRSVSRALLVLRALNGRMHSTLAELHRDTGLPKPTVYRILETLRADGYVREVDGRGSYQLTAKVRELSDGCSERLLIVDAAIPCMIDATRRIKWPLGLSTLDGDRMAVRYSTMPYSPLAYLPTTYGRRHPVTESCVGIAYLSFCSEPERRFLLPDGVPPRLESILEATRQRGYAVRQPATPGDSATCAVPLRAGDELLAVLSMTTFGSTMTASFQKRHVPVLWETADAILQAYRQLRDNQRGVPSTPDAESDSISSGV